MSRIEPISGYNDRVVLSKAIPLSTPFTLNIFPLNACNFRCNYCAQSLDKAKLKAIYGFRCADIMSIDTLGKIIDQAKKFDHTFKLVSFMGHGEPLLHPLLPEMIDRVYKSGIADRIEIITNASKLTPSLSDAIINAKLTNLRISLQGLSSDKYKQVSDVEIDFNRLVENITYFYEHTKETNVFVKIMDVSLNQGEEEKFYSIFDKISDRMYIERIKPVYDGVDYSKNSFDHLVDRYGNKHKPRRVCPLPFFTLSIWPNGDIASCDAIYNPVLLGNIHEHNLLGVWKSPKLNNFRLRLLKGEKNIIYGCQKCCAPDDVSHPDDELDSDAKELLAKFQV
ncbi:MAG TPA: radical SAM/SPASM domain-containing protein [Candidatus Brocadiaceae bacterium]